TGRELLEALEKVPGIRLHKTSSGRRSFRSIPVPADYAEPEDTAERVTQKVRVRDAAVLDAATAATDLIDQGDADEAARAHHTALRELAEELLHHGAKDYQLILGVADVKELENQLARHDAEMQTLEEQAE